MSKLQKLYWDELVPLSLPLAMILLGNPSFTFANMFDVFVVWTQIIMAGSLCFNVHASVSSHHAPSRLHEGDEFKSLDFGIYQIGAVFDRHESNSNLFMTLAHFGQHSLHHMFPSLDHTLLPQLQEVFDKTCCDFEVEMKKVSFLYGFVGHFQQLARTKTRKLKREQEVNINLTVQKTKSF